MNYEVRNNLLESENQLYKSELKARLDKIKELEEENRKLKEKIRFLEQCLDNKEKVNKSLREENRKLKEDIDNGFNRETDLRNKRADSLLENRGLRDKIEELEKEKNG